MGPPRNDETPLATGGVTHVVRDGQTVRRPVRPFTSTVQALLAHLHARGFHDAPRPCGYDDRGREVLSYVQGVVPTEPLPDWTAGSDVLVALARLIRRLHDAAEGWQPPSTATFGSIPGRPPAGVRPLFDHSRTRVAPGLLPGLSPLVARGLDEKLPRAEPWLDAEADHIHQRLTR